METLDVKTPRVDNNGKTWWRQVGVAFQNEGKPIRILLDAIPLPDRKTGDVVLILTERNKKDEVPQ
jgi:hypothetical protein